MDIFPIVPLRKWVSAKTKAQNTTKAVMGIFHLPPSPPSFPDQHMTRMVVRGAMYESKTTAMFVTQSHQRSFLLVHAAKSENIAIPLCRLARQRSPPEPFRPSRKRNSRPIIRRRLSRFRFPLGL